MLVVRNHQSHDLESHFRRPWFKSFMKVSCLVENKCFLKPYFFREIKCEKAMTYTKSYVYFDFRYSSSNLYCNN